MCPPFILHPKNAVETQLIQDSKMPIPMPTEETIQNTRVIENAGI